MPLTRRRVTSPEAMKALAHPLRLDVLELLVSRGPLTSTQAGDLLGQSAANMSWHLRKLAEHGFVREASPGPGRRRPWKIVAESLSWGDDAAEPTAVAALHDVAIEREVARLRAAVVGISDEPEPWRKATQAFQSRLWLTAEEAHELAGHLEQLLSTHVERGHDPASRPEGARLMALVGWVVPDRQAPEVGNSR